MTSWMNRAAVPCLLFSLAMLGSSAVQAQDSLLVDGQAAITKEDGPCSDNVNRYVDCGNGTVTDTVTGLIWMANSACTGIPGAGGTNLTDWRTAMTAVAGLEEGFCGLSDGSEPGDWRLPAQVEWEATVEYARDTLGCGGTALLPVWTNDAGTACRNILLPGAISGPYTETYWSATVEQTSPAFVDTGNLTTGTTTTEVGKFGNAWVWAVRGTCTSPTCSD